MKRKFTYLMYVVQMTLCTILAILPLAMAIRSLICGWWAIYTILYAVMSYVAYRLMVKPAYHEIKNLKN